MPSVWRGQVLEQNFTSAKFCFSAKRVLPFFGQIFQLLEGSSGPTKFFCGRILTLGNALVQRPYSTLTRHFGEASHGILGQLHSFFCFFHWDWKPTVTAPNGQSNIEDEVLLMDVNLTNFIEKYTTKGDKWISHELICSGNDKKKNLQSRYLWGSYLSMYYVAFTLNVKSMLNENLGGILGGTKC
jgi:hypothetical protein